MTLKQRFLRLVIFPGVILAASVFGVITNTYAQTSTGSILGTITDSSGASVPGALVTVTSLSTGLTKTSTTSSAGAYSIEALEPGTFELSVEANNFDKLKSSITVLVGQSANGNFTLRPKSQSTEVVVQSSVAETINLVQATVQSALTSSTIDNLPLNGRNFLDLAQLTPGVQIQDGGNFDPTKNGFTGISVQGRSGRSTRIEVDGVDISDETVGTTTINVSQDSIQEFQVAFSMLDPATSLTSTGAVNVITHSGGNQYHGSAFYLFRGNDIAANVGSVPAFFQRNDVGFRAGGPFVKNHLFWFVNYEHVLQHGTVFTQPPSPFTNFGSTFPSPFHETEVTARLDWNVTRNWRVFYSFHFDQFNVVTGFGGNVFQPYGNRNLTAVHTVGVDGNTGSFSHSFRYGYVRFRNFIDDARSQIPGLPEPFPGGQQAAIAIGNDSRCLFGTDVLCLGPSWLAPQTTLQRNNEIRYDGSYQHGSHTIRYGVDFTKIPQWTFGNFSGLGPFLNSNFTASERTFAASGPFPNGDSNPLNYPLEQLELGNGLGLFSELPAMGFEHGGFHLTRLGAYVADFWKVKPNLSLTMALRYNRLAGRTGSDLAPIPVLNELSPGLGKSANQPNLDFAPQLGLAWDPTGHGTTSIRAGVGLFYDDLLLTVTLFDRTLRIPAGLGNSFVNLTGGVVPGTNVDITPLIGQPIGNVVDQAIAAQAAFQAVAADQAANFNPKGIPGITDPNAFDFNSFGGLLDPRYHTPYSTQFNVGVEHQLYKTLFVSVDFVHNTNIHNVLVHDENLVGAAKTFDPIAAGSAITATEAAFGCGTIDCTIQKGATIFDYGNHGLGSPASGLAQQFVAPGGGFAFPGLNTSFGQMGIISTIGRSTYNSLQFRIRQNVTNPVRGIRQLSWAANYNLSRFDAMSPDQDASLVNVFDNADPTRFYGPSNLDRTQMFTFSGSATFPWGFSASWIVRAYSPLATTLRLPLACNCPAEIFLSDLTGDGSGGDVLPGTNMGSFGRGVSGGNINSRIIRFDSNTAGTLTPASEALLNSNLFTSGQLNALGAVVPAIPLAPAAQANIDNFVANDLRIAWQYRPGSWSHLPETFVIQPFVDIFNVINKHNFDPPNGLITSTLRGTLDGSIGSANGTTGANRPNPYGLGSGVFSQGIPRAFQFGLRIEF